MKNEGLRVIDLVNVWREQVKLLFGIEKQLSPRELGQLKMLRGKLGYLTRDVIEWALRNWERFCIEARSEFQLPSVPQAPHIGTLLAHADTAIYLMLSISTTKVSKSAFDIYFIDAVEKWSEQFPDEFAKVMLGKS